MKGGPKGCGSGTKALLLGRVGPGCGWPGMVVGSVEKTGWEKVDRSMKKTRALEVSVARPKI